MESPSNPLDGITEAHVVSSAMTVNGRKASLPAEDAATPVWSVLLEEVNEGNAKVAKSVKVPDMKRPF